MKYGRVVSFRLNPRDCVSCIDVANKLGLDMEDSGFNRVVKKVISYSLQSFRDNGIIPSNREGLFNELITAPFGEPTKKTKTRHLKTTLSDEKLSSDHRELALIPEHPELRRLRIRFNELDIKMEADPINFSEQDRAELQEVATKMQAFLEPS